RFVRLDIYAHEFTHGVTEHTCDLVYEFQPGALNESYSDVFACMVDGNWTIGEGRASGASRGLAGPTLFGQPERMSTFLSTTIDDDQGGVHTNSGIPNKAAFLISQGGTHNGLPVRGIGPAKTQRLYYDVLTTRLGENSQCQEARDLGGAQ